MINLFTTDNKFSWTLISIISIVLFILVVAITVGVIFYLNKKKESSLKVGSISEFKIITKGSKYIIGNRGKLSGGTGEKSYYKIKIVDKNGSVQSVNDIEIITKGINYTVGDVLTLEDSGEEKATIEITKVIKNIINLKPPNLFSNNTNTNTNTEKNKKQVFSTNNKIWTLKEAPYVCKSLGAELATYEQLVDAAKNGANWCNIGWFKEEVIKDKKGEKILAHAGFPVQKDMYDKIQDNLTGKHDINMCGPEWNPMFKNENYAIQNVGVYDNYKFAANCYGNKRTYNENEFKPALNNNGIDLDAMAKFNKELGAIHKRKPDIELLPFNYYKNRWDQY